MIITLLGPHAAGKTTLGRALVDATGWTFHDEIGKHLASDSTHRPPGVGPADPQREFDLEVFAREVARDLAFAAEAPDRIRIVETWHPGNLAYALLRSTDVAAAVFPYVRTAIDWSRVVVVPVTAQRETLERRKSYPEPLSYFLEVAATSLAIARAGGAMAVRPVCTDHASPEQLVTRLVPRLEGMARHVRSLPPAPRPVALA
ncbi:MAG: hypothetical protein OHK0013_01810 [Sandaracinaceae bacterium]